MPRGMSFQPLKFQILAIVDLRPGGDGAVAKRRLAKPVRPAGAGLQGSAAYPIFRGRPKIEGGRPHMKLGSSHEDKTMTAYAIFLPDRLREPETIKGYYELLPSTFEGRTFERHLAFGA